MPWAFQGAGFLVNFALRERPVVMGAAILDSEQFAGAVHNSEQLAFVFDDPAVAGQKLGDRAYGDFCRFVAHEGEGEGAGSALDHRPVADIPGK